MKKRSTWKIILPPHSNEESIRQYCRSCREGTSRENRPSEKAMNCWKIIVELDSSYENTLVKIVNELVQHYRDCWSEYRVHDNKVTLLIICRGWKRMWLFRKELINKLVSKNILDTPFLPYRRGGSYYDRDYGPWRLWAKNYYPEKLPLVEISNGKAVCPNDGSPMEYTGKGLLCSFCSLFIPETLLFEAIENGEAEYRPHTGIHKSNVYRIKYLGIDRFSIEKIR